MKINNTSNNEFVIFLAFCLFPLTILNAYIDPGLGGILLQIILGGITGVFIIVKLFLSKTKNRFYNYFKIIFSKKD